MSSYAWAVAMMMMILAGVACWAAGAGGGGGAPVANYWSGPLPEGNNGLAAKYPGDEGIEKDKGVVLADGFETGNLRQKWNAGVWQEESVMTTENPENVHRGKRALEFALPRGSKYGHGVSAKFTPGFDVLFVRYYLKFDKDDDFYNSAHDGVSIAAIGEGVALSTPGVRANGKNKFMASIDTWRVESDKNAPPAPGEWIIYCYHPEQRGDYGDNFYPRPKFLVQKDRWYCCEEMLKANTVGQRDGRVAFWVDGKLIGDFGNLHLRDVDALKINSITITLYIANNKVRDNRMWYDDLVAATTYIGPTYTGKPAGEGTTGKQVPPAGWGK